MNFIVETEQEQDGRWLAEVLELPGVLAYGDTPEQARAKAQLWLFAWSQNDSNTEKSRLI